MYGSHRMREVIGFRQTLVFTVFEVSACVSNLCVQSAHPFSASGGLYALIPIYSGVETDTEWAQRSSTVCVRVHAHVVGKTRESWEISKHLSIEQPCGSRFRGK